MVFIAGCCCCCCVGPLCCCRSGSGSSPVSSCGRRPSSDRAHSHLKRWVMQCTTVLPVTGAPCPTAGPAVAVANDATCGHSSFILDTVATATQGCSCRSFGEALSAALLAKLPNRRSFELQVVRMRCMWPVFAVAAQVQQVLATDGPDGGALLPGAFAQQKVESVANGATLPSWSVL